MDFMTVKEASVLWNMDVSNIGKLLRSDKIIGAKKIGGHWVIPKGAKKPADGRRKEIRSAAKDEVFRFPLYINSPEDSFVPALSADESALRAAQINFFAGNFSEAQKVFMKLSEGADSIYVRICSSFFMCILTMLYDSGKNWDYYYCKLNLLLAEDFPHKPDIELFVPWLFSFTMQFNNINKNMNFQADYKYSESALPMISFLSVFRISEFKSDKKILNIYFCHMKFYATRWIHPAISMRRTSFILFCLSPIILCSMMKQCSVI